MNSVKRTGADGWFCWLSISRRGTWPRLALGGTGGGGGKARGTMTSFVNSPKRRAC